MNLIIERLDGKFYNLETLGIKVGEFAVSSPYYNTDYQDVEGYDGVVDMGTTLGYRTINLMVYTEAEEMDDYARKRDEVFRVFESRQPFYIKESRNPTKRWLVKVYGSFTPDQKGVFGLTNISLTVPSGSCESVNVITRSYEENMVYFQNQGDILIDPRTQRETEITFKGASTGLTITNETTGDVWKHTGSTAAGDTILLKGVQSLKNGVSIFRDTNKKLLTFAPGVNKLTISGAPSVNLTIRTRFYFL